MSFQTNNDDDQDQDQATTTLSHNATTMFQFATTTTDHESPLMEHVQHQPFENGLDEFPNHSSNSESLRRIREEQPQDEEKEEKDEQTSPLSSLALTTTHQDEAAVLHALVASSLFNGLPTVTLFLIMEFVDSVHGGLSRLMSLSSSMHRVVNIFLERLSKQESFAVTTSGRRCLQNTMELLRMLSKRGNGYDMARIVSLVLAEGVHVVGPEILTVPLVNLSIGIKEQEKGKEKDKVDIIGGLKVVNGVCLCLTDVTVKNSSGNGLEASGAGTQMVLQNVNVENNQYSGVYVDGGAQLVATECHFHQNGWNGVWVAGSTTTARLTNCKNHHNEGDGVQADERAVVDLMGEQTSVHGNEGDGLFAYSRGTINVYRPCFLNFMSHGNKGQNIYESRGCRVQQKTARNK